MDIYQALIGAAPSGVDQQAAIAEQLRRRRSLGELGALTGDRVLQPFGQGVVQQADSYAQQMQDIRQKDIDNAQTKAYQDGQLGHMGNVLQESIRAQNMDDATTRRGQDLDLEAARLRAARAGGRRPGSGRLRQGDIKDLQDISETIGILDGVERFIDEGGNFGAVEIGGVALPGAREASNALANRGLGTEDMKRTALAKQNFDRLYTLTQRNRMFGATLTANEQKAWESANPSVRQTDAQIMQAIPIMRKALMHRAQGKANGLVAEGYNPEAIDYYMGTPNIELPTGNEEVVDSDGIEEEYTAPEGNPDDYAPAVDPAWTPEKQARLEFLRKKLRVQ